MRRYGCRALRASLLGSYCSASMVMSASETMRFAFVRFAVGESKLPMWRGLFELRYAAF